MAKKPKSKTEENPEFERTKEAFRKILAVPKEKKGGQQNRLKNPKKNVIKGSKLLPIIHK